MSSVVYFPTPKGLFPPELEHYRGPKLKVAFVGAGLADISTAVELLDQGHDVSCLNFKSLSVHILFEVYNCFDALKCKF